jgi:hypothetical protein
MDKSILFGERDSQLRHFRAEMGARDSVATFK